MLGEATSTHLFHYFNTIVLFRSIYFFRATAFFKELRFRKSHFLAAFIFSEYLIVRNETSTEQSLCENRKFFRAVAFLKSYFSGGVFAQNKDIYRRAPLIDAGASAQHQLFQKSYVFKKAIFSEKKYSALLTFSRELPFCSSHFFKRRYLLYQEPFQQALQAKISLLK